MRIEVTVEHSTVYVIDDSDDTCYVREAGGDYGEITQVLHIDSPRGISHEYRQPLPDWLAHELKAGRAGEMLESARINGTLVLDDSCEECGDPGLDPDAKGPDGRRVCDRCRDADDET